MLFAFISRTTFISSFHIDLCNILYIKCIFIQHNVYSSAQCQKQLYQNILHEAITHKQIPCFNN